MLKECILMKYYKIIIVFFALFLVAGQSCSNLSLGGKKDTTKVDDFTGKEGLNIELIEGLPPKDVWKGIDFGILLEAWNKGVNDVDAGKICIGSFPSTIFGKSDSCLALQKIMGRRNYPGGEIQVYGEEEWEGFKIKDNYPVHQDAKYSFSARVCYQYSTFISPTACIRDLRMGDNEAVCQVGELSLNNNGQGAPVGISSIREDIVPRGDDNELLFTIKVQNSDDGEIIKRDAITRNKDCNFDRKDKDVVIMDLELPGFGKANCRNNGEVVMINGEGQAFCSGIKVPSGESFALPLNIKLTYGYLSRIQGDFTIKKDIVEA